MARERTWGRGVRALGRADVGVGKLETQEKSKTVFISKNGEEKSVSENTSLVITNM